jgi:hypothetical protein
MMKYVGIDLGQKGAIAVQTKKPFSKPTLEIFPFWGRHGGTRLRTLTDEELVRTVQSVVALDVNEIFVTIEHPIFMPVNGKKAIAGMFKHFGILLGVCHAHYVDQLWIPKPTQWKKETGAHGSDKFAMAALASNLFKNPMIDELTADAVLISEACRLHFKD